MPKRDGSACVEEVQHPLLKIGLKIGQCNSALAELCQGYSHQEFKMVLRGLFCLLESNVLLVPTCTVSLAGS